MCGLHKCNEGRGEDVAKTASVRYVLVNPLVLSLEMLLRPLVSTVLAPVRVAKVINLH